MRTSFVLALLVACAGEPPADPTPTADPAPTAEVPLPSEAFPDVPIPDVSAERTLVAAGPPPAPGPVTQVFERLGEQVGGAVVRCPLAGGGRGEVFRGRASDHSITWGIPVGLEDGAPPPWSTALDLAASDGEWLVFLAEPGDTHTTVRTLNRSLRYTHPPATLGATVTCSAVDPGLDRIVRGRVEAPRPPQLLVMPCVPAPPPVGTDGTFAALIRTPCSLWVEGGGLKSEKVLVEPGSTPVELRFHLEPDPMQVDGHLTAEAVTQVLAYLDASKALDTAAAKALDTIDATMGKLPGVSTVQGLFRNRLRDRTILTEKADRALRGAQ
jgi:hypothetical protein